MPDDKDRAQERLLCPACGGTLVGGRIADIRLMHCSKCSHPWWPGEVTWATAEIQKLRAELDRSIGSIKAADRLVGALIETYPKNDPVRPMLCWTSEKPTEPADYWIRSRSSVWAALGELVQVEIYPNLEPKNQVVIRWGGKFPAVPPDAEWWGPVSKPE